MPLIQGKSRSSIGKNIGTEVNAGKPQDQAAAIAYSIARKMKEKKMSEGGYVEEPEMKEHYDEAPEVTSEIHPIAHLMHKEFMKKFSLGGMVSDDTHMDQMPDTDDDDEIAQGMEYPKDLEEEEQKHSAQDFIRSYMTSRAMRKR